MVPLEDEEAEALSSYLKAKGIWHTHVPNEIKAKPQYYAKRKRMGVSKGFPDYCILVPTVTQGICTVFIELKRQRKVLKNGKIGASPSATSEEQISWILELNKCESTEAIICYGAEEAIEYVEELKKV